jgi:hypothetical protein
VSVAPDVTEFAALVGPDVAESVEVLSAEAVLPGSVGADAGAVASVAPDAAELVAPVAVDVAPAATSDGAGAVVGVAVEVTVDAVSETAAGAVAARSA